MSISVEKSTTQKTKIGLFYLIKEFPFHFLLHYGLAALSAFRISNLIGYVTKVLKSGDSSIAQKNIWELLGRILLVCIIAYFHIGLGIYCEEVFSSHLRKKLTQRFLSTSFSQAQKEKYLLTRYDNDAFNVGTLASRIYNRSFFSLVSIVLLFWGFIKDKGLHWVIPWCLGFLLVMAASAMLLYWLAYRYHLKRNKRIEKENKYFKELNDNLEYIKISGSEKKEVNKSNNLLNDNLKKNTSFAVAKATYATIPSYLLRHSVPLILVFLYKGADWSILLSQISQIFGEGKTIIEMFWAHGGYDTYCTSLSQLNHTFKTLEENNVGKNVSLSIKTNKYDINFQQVNFAYFPENKILENFSFTFQQGKKYAILGPNGIGKSTIFKLILKLYQPQEGNVKLGDVDLAEINNSFLTEKVFYLSNRSFFFNDTVVNNIMYPNSYEKEKNLTQLISIANELEVSDLINKLPQGWETIIEEKGNNLSEGQKQLISLMRLFINDYEIYLFDEILNNVNNEHRQKILAIIFRKLKNKTAIFITHDLEDLKYADEVYNFTSHKLIKK